MNLIFEVLDKKKHNFKNFDCGKEVMNSFLKRFALKNQKLNISKTWVVFDADAKIAENKSEVIAYFTFASQSIAPQLITDKKLPNYPVPTTLLARIALDLKFQNQGLGKELLFIALEEALRLCETGIPAYAVILDVLDEEALAFYQKFNFLRKLGNSTNQLFVRMTTLEEMFNKTI